MKRYWLVALMLYNSFMSSLPAGEPPNSVPYTAYNIHYGFIIPHSESIRSISRTHPFGAEIELGLLHTGEKSYAYCNCYPKTGLSLLLFSFDNPDIIGNMAGATVYVEPFMIRTQKFHFSYRFALGIGYLNKPFDEHSNPANLFYSTHINGIATLATAANYHITPLVTARTVIHYNHISNGGISRPNKGINYPTMSMGLMYSFKPPAITAREKAKNRLYIKKWYYRVMIFGTGKTKNLNEDKKYPIWGIYADAGHLAGRLSILSLGFEAEKNLANRQIINEQGLDTDHHRISAVGGHNLLIGRFMFSQFLGYYIHSPFRARDILYQRYALQFSITGYLFTAINLKAHRQVADYMDLRIGYLF